MKFVGQLLSSHLLRYPAMQLPDVYKLLHQAALGPGHAIRNADSALEHLRKESSALLPGPDEPLQDIISPDGRLARIHLRPYLAAGRSIQMLHEAFVATANTYPASPEKLAKFCACLGDLADAGGISFDRDQVVTYFDRIAQSGYPVVHHSAEFAQSYKPAYRVVAIDLLTP